MQKPQRKVMKGLAYEYYWTCPECEHRHIAYYTDKKIRRDVKRQGERWARYRVAGSVESERKLLAQINMEDKLIKQDMDALMDKMQKEA